MIPLSARENVTLTDEDGVVWTFKPKTGDNERELMAFMEEGFSDFNVARLDKLGDFFDRVVVSWKDEKGRMPKIAEGKKPSSLFAIEEKINVLGDLWNRANRLTKEEKKT